MWLLIVTLNVTLQACGTADKIDDAEDRANQFFVTGSFTTKVDLEDAVSYLVKPDGQPPKYNRRGSKSGKLAFHAGDQGTGIYIKVNKRVKVISVSLQVKRAKIPWRAALINIFFNRELTAADVDPRVIARALAAYVEFDGLEVGQEIGAAMDRLNIVDDPDIASQVTDSTKPNLISLAAVVSPTRPRRGEDVFLELQFEVHADELISVEVTSSRTLKRRGVILPGYPVENIEQRTAGRHSSQYRQPIPMSAELGEYEYRGEVCFKSDCISRTVVFNVE